MFAPGSTWFDAFPDLGDLISTNDKPPSTTDRALLITGMRTVSEEICKREATQHQESKRRESPSDFQWSQTVMKSGTLSDRISALSLNVLESYIHGMGSMDILIAIAKKKSPRESILAVDSLKSVFLGSNSKSDSVLPSGRKLKFLTEQPLVDAMLAKLFKERVIDANGKVIKDIAKISNVLCQALCLWFVEDHLKRSFYTWIVCLDTLAKSPVGNIKNKVINHAWELLANKREQERTLLSFIVNKLGDQDRKVASKIVHLLLKLLEKHSVMKLAVVKEVETFFHRETGKHRSQYYALVFLNQISFQHSNSDVKCARYLCGVYFQLFESFIDKSESKTDIEDKIMAAILTGISRAYPYACVVESESLSSQEEVSSFFEKHVTSLYRAVHSANCSFKTSVQALQILYRLTFSEDSGLQANVVSQTMLLRFNRAIYASLHSLRASDSSKTIGLYLNLLFKTLKSTGDVNSFMALVRRILQVVLTGPLSDNPALMNGALVSISEGLRQNDVKSLIGLFKNLLHQSPACKDDDDEEENFKDVPEDDEEIETVTELKGKSKAIAQNGYDAFGRSPEFSNAGGECAWELTLLAQHFHPTTRLFANTILAKDEGLVNYPSDPLVDFTINRFLDKFVYRNPKKGKMQSGAASAKSTSKSSGEFSRITHAALPLDRAASSPVTADDWQKKVSKGEAVPVDEVFFAKYFSGAPKKASKGKKDVDNNVEEVGEEDAEEIAEEEINAALMGGMANDELGAASDNDLGDEDLAFSDGDFSADEEGQEGDTKIAAESQDASEDDFESGDDLMFADSGSDDEDDLSLAGSDAEDMDEIDDEDNSFKKKSKTTKVKKRIGIDIDETLRQAVGDSKKSGNMGVFAAVEDFSHLLNMDSSSSKAAKHDSRDEKMGSNKRKRPSKTPPSNKSKRSRKPGNRR